MLEKIGELDYHAGGKDTVFDKNDNLEIVYAYTFYDNKLVGGKIFFYTPQSSTDFFDAVEALNHRHGKPVLASNGEYCYLLPTTIVSYKSTDIKAISLLSNDYIDGAIERSDRAKEQTKQNNYNRLFN